MAGRDGPVGFFRTLAATPIGPDQKRLDFDVIGLRFYPAWGDDLAVMKRNVSELIRDPRKDVLICETGYPWRPLPNADGAAMKWPRDRRHVHGHRHGCGRHLLGLHQRVCDAGDDLHHGTATHRAGRAVRRPAERGRRRVGAADDLQRLLPRWDERAGRRDLAVAGSLPKSVIAGQKAAVRQTLTLAGAGGAAFGGPVTTQYFLDTGTNLDADAVALTSATTGTDTIKAGKHVTSTLRLTSLPATVPAGTYHVIAKVTDASGDASVAASAGTVTVAPPTVSLSGKVAAVAPSAATPGKTLSFTLVLSNAGNVNSTGPATYAVYLSADGKTETVAATLKSKPSSSPTVRAGRSLSVRLTVTVPAVATATSLYPLVVFTQDGMMVTAAVASPVAVS